MQTTELFVSDLEKNISKNPHGSLTDFLPSAHASLPDIQENLMYICASGRQKLAGGSQYSISDIDCYMLLYTVDGQGIIDVSGDTCSLSGGDLLLWDCQDAINIRAVTKNWDVEMLYINGVAITAFYEEICKIDFPKFDVPDGTLPHCLIQELLSLGTDITPHHAFLAHKLLTDLFSDLIMSMYLVRNDESAIPSYINEICRLFENSCQTDYSMDELALRYRVNRYRLTRDFSQYVGITPVKFLNNVRIEHAKVLLETTNMPVGAIGSYVGIHNATHFINMYKEKTGMTPLVYRERYRAYKEISRSSTL